MGTIDFAASERSRIGLEWEIACVDRRSGERRSVPVASAAADIRAEIGHG